MRNFELSKGTKAAEVAEQRRRRLQKTYQVYEDDLQDDAVTGKVVNVKRPAKDPPVRIIPEISCHLKPHQVEAVRFMVMRVVMLLLLFLLSNKIFVCDVFIVEKRSRFDLRVEKRESRAGCDRRC